MAAPQPGPTVHTGPWTLDAWLALPDRPPYTELVDGLLIMSPASATTRARDAAAGIPFLLMVDPSCQPPSAACYELLDGDYVERVRSEGGFMRLDRPFPVQLDLTLPSPPAVE